MSDTNREEFEAWVTASGRASMLQRDKDHGWYKDLTVTAWWTAWQAAREQPERVVLSDIAIIGIASHIFTSECDGDPMPESAGEIVTFARAILAAQADVGNAEVRSKLICPKCKVDRLTQPCQTLSDCGMGATAQVSASRSRTPLSDEDNTAFHKAAENRDQAVELPSGALMFINYGEGPQDYSDLDCPHCGGSGHKGDIAAQASTQPVIAEATRDDDKHKPIQPSWGAGSHVFGSVKKAAQ